MLRSYMIGDHTIVKALCSTRMQTISGARFISTPSANSLNQKLKVILSGGFTSGKNNLPSYDPDGLCTQSFAPLARLSTDTDGSLNWANGNWHNPIARFRQK